MRKARHKFSEQAILDAFREKHGTKYRYPPLPDKFTVKSIVPIICPIHGEFRQTIEHHMNGQGCRKCGNIRLGRAEWIRRFESVHGRGKYDYSKVPAYPHQNAKIEIYCPEHNVSFYQTPHQHWRRGQGCPKCGLKKQGETLTKKLISRREFIRKAVAVHGLMFEYSELPVEFSLNDTIIIYCNEHRNAFFCKAQDHLNGKDAPKGTRGETQYHL